MLSRRDLLKLGLAGTPYILMPHDRAYARVPPSFIQNDFQSPPSTPFDFGIADSRGANWCAAVHDAFGIRQVCRCQHAVL